MEGLLTPKDLQQELEEDHASRDDDEAVKQVKYETNANKDTEKVSMSSERSPVIISKKVHFK